MPTGRKNRKEEEILKPSPVIDYNKAKNSADMSISNIFLLYAGMQSNGIIRYFAKLPLEPLL